MWIEYLDLHKSPSKVHRGHFVSCIKHLLWNEWKIISQMDHKTEISTHTKPNNFMENRLFKVKYSSLWTRQTLHCQTHFSNYRKSILRTYTISENVLGSVHFKHHRQQYRKYQTDVTASETRANLWLKGIVHPNINIYLLLNTKDIWKNVGNQRLDGDVW